MKLMPGRICALELMAGRISAFKLPGIDAWSNLCVPGRIQSKMRQYTFTSTILHLLKNILLGKKPTKLYNEAEVDLRSKSTGYIKLLQF